MIDEPKKMFLRNKQDLLISTKRELVAEIIRLRALTPNCYHCGRSADECDYKGCDHSKC